MTKLQKILWYADREYMYKYFDTITKGTYRKLPYGPANPKIEKIIKKLEKDGKIFEKPQFIGGKPQRSFISLKEPDISEFSPVEISIIDKYTNKITSMTASKISELTHDELWKKTPNGQIMPVESVFNVKLVSPSEEDIKEALEYLDSKAKTN